MLKSFTNQKYFTVKIKKFIKPMKFIHHRLFLLPVYFSLTFLTACSSNTANAYNYSIKPDNLNTSDYNSKNQRINILSSFIIKTKTKDNIPITELSDLAWDADEKLLYAVSDSGFLYHLEIDVQFNQLKKVNIIKAMALLDKNGKAVKGKLSDAEGLSLINGENNKQGDSELIISFENKPRIVKYLPNGRRIKKIKTVKKLRKRKYFRDKNKALESVTLNPKHGILTAAEKPLRENPLSQQTIFSNKGKEWHFAASKVKNSSITALETISNDKILILERAYNGFLAPVVISLRQLNLDKCESSNTCEVENLARLDSSEGWALDNFEGLTHFKNNQYLMVSDNNNNPLQKTILVLFEILSSKK